MDETNKKPDNSYTLKETELDKGFWGKIGDWFVTLFKGYWYGMTDLFLASWKNIVLLVMLLIIPLVYGIVCALGYWNPIDNLGKMEIPIFDQDRTFLKVQAKEGSIYHIGALKEVDKADGSKIDYINADNSINDSVKIDDNTVKNFAEGDTLILNNGFKVTYADGVDIKPMNTWDILKKNVLLKTSPDESDTDSKFSLASYPMEELNFRNLRYVNNQDKINKYWQTGKYQAQIKISDGYGAALVGLQGVAYDKDALGEMATNTDLANFLGTQSQSKLPNMDMFQTFQKNFVSAFVLGDMSNFASQIADQIQPFTNAVKDNANVNEEFGTKGTVVKKFLESAKDPTVLKALQPTIDKLSDSEYYLIPSEKDFVSSLKLSESDFNDQNFDSQTLFGDNLTNGKFASWLTDVNYFATSTGYGNVKADNSNTLKLIKNIEDMYNTPNSGIGDNNSMAVKGWETQYITNNNSTSLKSKDAPVTEDFIGAVKDLLTIPYSLNASGSPVKNLTKSIVGTLSPLYGTDLQNKWDNVDKDFQTFTPFAKTQILPSSTVNLFGIFTKIMSLNEHEYFGFLQPVRDQLKSNGQSLDMLPVNILGSAYGTMTTTLETNGVNPGALLKMEQPRGQQMSVYGIGLGQMFIFLGLYIGFTMLRAVITRNKQYGKLTASNWYISKFLQYLTIGIVIVTMITWVMYGAAWHQYVSAAGMGYEFLWFIMSMVVLLSVIIGLQYAFAPMVGAALAVLYLAINVTCSGSSYPGWMELGFYRGITYVTPFKYMIEGSDQIIYGVNLLHQNWAHTPNAAHILHIANNEILELWGYASCFFVFFFFGGLLCAQRSYRVSLYGSQFGSRVAKTFAYLGRTDVLDKFVIKTTNKKGKAITKYNWKAIVGPFDPEIFETTDRLKKKKSRFKWYAELRKKRKIEEMERYER